MKSKLKLKKVNKTMKLQKKITTGLVKFGSNMFIKFLLLFIVLLAVNYFSKQYFVRFDLTENKQYSLTDSTKDILGKLEEKVKISVYISDDIPPEFLPARQNIIDLLTEYDRFGGDEFIVDIKDSNSDSFKTDAMAAGLEENPFQVLSDDSYEIARGFYGLNIEYKEESVPMILTDASRLEYDLTSNIYQLTNEDITKIGYLTGHGEKDFPLEYGSITTYMKSQYDLVSVDLSNGEPIDKEIKALIIVAPSEDLSKRDMFELDQYVVAGGNVIILADTYTNDFQSGMFAKKDINLNTFLNRYGLNLDNNIIADRSSTPVSGYLFYPYWVLALSENINSDIPVLESINSSTFLWGSSVSAAKDVVGNQKYTALVSSTLFAWSTDDDSFTADLEVVGEASDRRQVALVAMISGELKSYYADKEIPKLEGDKEDKRPADLAIVKKGEKGNILLFGDSDFISDQFIMANEQNDDLFIVICVLLLH